MPDRASKRILIVDDAPELCNILYNGLKLKGYTVFTASNGRDALKILRRNNIAIVVSDIRMPEMNGEVLLRRIKRIFPHIPVVMITGYGTLSDAVRLIKQGATDYITKPFSIDELCETIEKLLYNSREASYPSSEIITDNLQMAQILETISIVANSRANIFIQGEIGTGKKLIARVIHEHSRQRDEPFVVVNCAEMPVDLLESELFGREQNLPADMIFGHSSVFELANRGTLLLAEITEMPLSLQAKLLKVIREIDRISSTEPNRINVRLCVIRIVVPPLRDRKEDISLLANYLLEEISRKNNKEPLSISEEATKALESYEWPGNVRELKDTVEKAVLSCQGNILSVRDFFPYQVQERTALV